MAASKRKTSKKITTREIVLALITFFLGVLFGGYGYDKAGPLFTGVSTSGDEGSPTMHFVDVGQGDCTLITYNGDAVLIDAGPVSSGETAAAYVKNCVDAIDYFIITHPHEDHMGGAAAILESIEVENVIMPEVEVSTRFYENAMNQIAEKNVNVIYSEPLAVYDTGSIKITILDSLLPDTDNLNNVSIMARIDVGSTSIMTTGDAEIEEENVLLQNYVQLSGPYARSLLDCDLLKVGHHGSTTSTSSEFLTAVSPSVCVISCGAGNSYGHPHKETVDLLTEYGAQIYRTDLSGTVVLYGEP
ncbi:MAG: ComEC/Rec2 family competence protein [Eubacteriales bacterium]